MTRRQKAYNAAQDAAPQSAMSRSTAAQRLPPDPEHFLPDAITAELVRTLGSARAARKKWEGGDKVGAGVDAALGLPDAYANGAILKGLMKKGGVKIFGPKNWHNPPWKQPGAREWLEQNGFINRGEKGHHWLIPQNGWGKAVPEWIKNQPWNIKGMDDVPHRRSHGRAKVDGEWLPEFTDLEKFWSATPAYFKALVGGVVLDAPNTEQPGQQPPARIGRKALPKTAGR
jgi:hypothetical protein